MWYAIISEDVEGSLPLRAKARPAHLERVQALAAEAGFSGSLVIVEFDSLDDAKEWAEADPYVTAGVYKSIAVKPFKRILP